MTLGQVPAHWTQISWRWQLGALTKKNAVQGDSYLRQIACNCTDLKFRYNLPFSQVLFLFVFLFFLPDSFRSFMGRSQTWSPDLSGNLYKVDIQQQL